jgi:hypothetical protein
MRRWLLLLLSIGCHSNVVIETSALEGRSALVWIYADGELHSLWGADLDGGRLVPPPPGIAYEEKIEMLAMTFACPLADTGLVLGAQELLEFPEYDAPRTPAPRKIAASKIEGDVQEEWRELSEPDPRMQESLLLLNLPEDNICSRYAIPYRRFADATIQTDDRSQVVLAEAIDDHRILIGTEVGALYEISDDGSYRELEDIGLAESPEALEFRAAFRDPEGRMWLYAADGRVARGTIDGGFELMEETSTATGAEAALAGSAEGAPFELFAVTSSRKLAHFDGTRWRTVYQGSRLPICDLGIIGEIVMPPTATWVAPGEAVVHGAGEAEGMVLRYRDGQAFEESFPPVAGSPASVLQTDLGTFAGTCEGDLVRRVEQTWAPAFPKRADTVFPIVSMVRSGAGFLYPGIDNAEAMLATYHPSIGYCIGEMLEGIGRFIVRTGRTIYVVYLRDRRDPIRVILFEEGDPPCFAVEG